MKKLKRIILVTGPPGIGKTTIIRRTVNELRTKEYAIGGVICHEVREGGLRVGFELLDLSTGQRGWLAHVNQLTGPAVGKYHINLIDLDIIGAGSILDAVKNAEILAIDEIGPMELLSTAFSQAILEAVESNKPLLGTIHYKLSNSLIDRIKIRDDIEIIKITRENRGNLHKIVAEKIINCLV